MTVVAALAAAPDAEAKRKKPKADLVVKSVSAAGSVEAGWDLGATDTTSNAGKGKSKPTATRFWLSADAKLGAGDTELIGDRVLKALRPGKKATGQSTAMVPFEVVAGTYRLLACADAERQAKEAKEKNNCRAAKGTVSVTPPPERSADSPSSFDLIDAALERGELTEEQAILYRAFATMGDRRLPPQFRAGSLALQDSTAMLDAATRWGELSPQTRAALVPLFSPPFLAGSESPLASPRAGGQSSPPPLDAPTRAECAKRRLSGDWESVENGRAKVWYLEKHEATDKPAALSLLSWAETNILNNAAKITGEDGYRPDGGLEFGSCRGGDDRMDIVLAEGIKSLDPAVSNEAIGIAIPYGPGGCPTPSWIGVDRTLSGNKIRDVLAHEIFHVIQMYWSQGSCANHWFMESSADWFMDLVFPEDDFEHRAAPAFMGTAYETLTYMKPALRPYGGYLFWQYLYLFESHDTMRRVFGEFAGGADAMTAIDRAIGGFDVVWPRFALHLWNGHAAEFSDSFWHPFLTRDRLKANVPYVKAVPRLAEQTGTMKIEGALPGLSASYFYYDFGSRLLEATPKHLVFTPPKAPGLTVHAIPKIEGTWRDPVEWTGTKEFCRNISEEYLNDLVLIVSNSGPPVGSTVDLAGAGGKIEMAKSCPTELRGNLRYREDYNRPYGPFSGEPGESSTTEIIEMSVRLRLDKDTGEWEDAGTTAVRSGNTNGWYEAGDCRIDFGEAHRGNAPPIGSTHFSTVGSGASREATWQLTFTGRDDRAYTVQPLVPDPHPPCGDGDSLSFPAAAIALCDDGPVTTDSLDRMTINFNYSRNKSDSRGGSGTETCTGTLKQTGP